MNVVILAGGLGSRLAEETELKPKPMVEVGGYPILWHIMKHYAHYGFKEFFLALGYKGEMIKRYFLDYSSLNGSMTINLASGEVATQDKACEDWTIHLIDTGLQTLTGGRVKKLQPLLRNETFMVTYGDGVSDVDITGSVKFHKAHGKLATVTAVRPPARFGGLHLEGTAVKQFSEKPQAEGGWINGGFFVFEPGVLDYLGDDSTILEREPLERLAADGELMAFRHDGFFQPMDTLRERDLLEGLWAAGDAPWKTWK